MRFSLEMENAFQSILEYSRVLGMCTEQTQGNHLIFLKNLLKVTDNILSFFSFLLNFSVIFVAVVLMISSCFKLSI